MKHSTNNEKLYFEIYKDQHNLFYFNLKDEDGNIYLESWRYTNKTNCRKGIKTVIRNSKNEFRFEVEIIYDDTWIVYLKAGNGKRIAHSQYFDTEEEAKNFIEDLKNVSLKTPVIDNTKTMIDSNNNKKYFFEIDKAKGNLFYLYLRDGEGNIYLGSYFYKQKNKCEKWIKSVIKNSKNEEHFIIKQDYNDTWIVFMEDGNGIIIAYSQYFDTEKEARNFIIKLKHISNLATVIDITK